VKLVSYGPPGAEVPGFLDDDGVIRPIGSRDTNEVIALIHSRKSLAWTGELDAGTVRLGPPVPRPSKIVVCGVNYPVALSPRKPMIGLKPPTSLAGPNDPVVKPFDVEELDYEAELAVVIGAAGRRIPRDQALAQVAGYMCAQDLGAHDVFRGDTDLSPTYGQIVRGKSFDTFCPTGPWLLTADEVPDPGELRIRCWVNDELRQDAFVREMIVDVPGLVEWVSSSMTLLPGDILLTGTPAGMGIAQEPPQFLRAGDVLRTEITGLGGLRNEIRDESA
jgi:2,4-didehydro-3-deoxy-L-rhamnonate hydrolase